MDKFALAVEHDVYFDCLSEKCVDYARARFNRYSSYNTYSMDGWLHRGAGDEGKLNVFLELLRLLLISLIWLLVLFLD